MMSDASTHRADLRSWFGLAALVLPVFLIAVDMTVLGFAVPHLSADLGPSSMELLWIIDAYGFLIAGLLVTMGSLGDRIGRRRLLLLGTTAFAAASALAALSTGPTMLIAARALLGVAGATLMPSTLSLLRSLFPHPRQRVVAVAVWASGFSAGASFGPVLGGLLLEHFYWGSVFLINIPVAAVIIVSVLTLVPESRDPAPGPLDLPSVGLSLTGMLLAVYGLKSLLSEGASVLSPVALLVGALLLVVFVRRQRRLEHPLIDVRLFGISTFRAGVVANFMLVFSLVASLFFLTQLLQLVYGLRPMVAGLYLVPGLALSVVGGFVVIPVARRYGIRPMIAVGLGLIASGFAALTVLPAGGSESSGAVYVAVAFAVLCLGTGLAETLTNDAILSAAPPARAGAASSISETAYELGGALGIAVLGSVLSIGYGNGIHSRLPDFPTDLIDSAAETLGGADHLSRGLDPSTGAQLWRAATESFVSAIHLTSGVATVLALLSIAVVWALFRPSGQPATRESDATS